MNAESRKGQKKKIRVGDHVRFLLADREIDGVVVEDRGFIGARGRRLWAIEFKFLYTDPSIIELPEVDILVNS